MKRRPAVWAVLLIALLVLVGCAAKQSMEGTWEQEITISVLGTNVDDQTEVSAIQRFQFHADGTGSMTTDAGEDFPVASVTTDICPPSVRGPTPTATLTPTDTV